MSFRDCCCCSYRVQHLQENPREISWSPLVPLRSSRGPQRHPTTRKRWFDLTQFLFCPAHSFCPCDRNEGDNGFFDTNPAMRHRPLFFADEGAKRWGD